MIQYINSFLVLFVDISNLYYVNILVNTMAKTSLLTNS